METENVCLDSCFIIDLLRKDEGAREFLEKNTAALYITDLNLFEISDGAVFGKGGKKNIGILFNLLDDVQIIPALGNYGLNAAKISASLQRKGSPVGDMDCLISSVMLNSGINKIVTRNVKHFEKIPGIKVLKY